MKHLLLGLLALIFAATARSEESSLLLPSGESISYQRYPAKGGQLLLWFASERGLSPAEIRAAQELAANGTEVWQFDLTAALFLPQILGSMDGIAVQDVKAIVESAGKAGEEVSMYAVGRAAVPVLRAMASLQSRPSPRLLLMHPNFYAAADALVGANYISFGDLRGVSLLILQPRRSAATPWLDDQLEALRKEGADARALLLEGVREGYWVRESATDFETAEGGQLANRIAAWRELLK